MALIAGCLPLLAMQMAEGSSSHFQASMLCFPALLMYDTLVGTKQLGMQLHSLTHNAHFATCIPDLPTATLVEAQVTRLVLRVANAAC